MSAYVCEDRTYNRIASGLCSLLLDRGCAWMPEDLDYDLPNEIGHLVQDMWTMNVDAVCSRYEDEASDNYERPAYEYVYCSRIQLLKALRCYLYQCSEGSVPGRTLYQVLNELSHNLALEIVSELPEYAQADWV